MTAKKSTPKKSTAKKPATKKSTSTAKPTTSKASTPVASSVASSVSGALSQKLATLNKNYQTVTAPEFIKTGSLVMDALLGGGVPRGSFILWSSHSGIGKTTGSLFIAKSYCTQGLKVMYLDFEGALNMSQIDGIGLSPYYYDEKSNPNGTFFCYRVQSYTDAETCLDLLLDEVDLVVIDSITAVLPEKLQNTSVESIQPGVQARLMTHLLLKYKTKTVKSGASWIMINQMRTHIRFVGMTTDEEAGGNALKFYSDYRIMMKEAYKGKLERNEVTPKGVVKVPYGSVNEIWCIKSRYSRPFIPLQLGVVFGKGISNNHAYYDFLKFKNCIRKDGSWFTIDVDGVKGKVQGETKVLEWIALNRNAVKDFVLANGGYRLIMDETDMDESAYALYSKTEPKSEEDIEDETIVMGTLDDSVQ